MSTLQVVMTCSWCVIILGAVYWLGEQFGSGWKAVLGFLTVVVFYSGIAALLFFTAKAIFGF